jgi:TRAP-type C4-dicarboxylate transport system permease small subunit
MNRHLAAALEWVAAAFLAAVLVTVVLQVFFRYVAGWAVPWTEELTRYLGIWMVFVGAAAGVAGGAHIAVTVLLNRFPGRTRRLVQRGIDAALLFFSLVILAGSLRLIQLNWQQQAVTFPVSVAVLYVAVGLFAAISVLALVARLWAGGGS